MNKDMEETLWSKL